MHGTQQVATEELILLIEKLRKDSLNGDDEENEETTTWNLEISV